MALIKCEECGQMVSDKAEACMNCGCPIEKKIECEECGGDLEENDRIVPKCNSSSTHFNLQMGSMTNMEV